MEYPWEYTLLHFQKLSSRAITPRQATPGSVGLDLYSPVDIAIPPRKSVCVPIDLAFAIPTGYYGRIASKSGLAIIHGITVEAGVIDPDYRGNVGVVLRNHSKIGYYVKFKEPIGQLILEKATVPELKEVQDLTSTTRGASGFGSTYHHPQ